jgi:hypothetical protein
VEHLERDRALVLEIQGEINDCHATAAELALEHVAIPKSIGHRRVDERHEVAWRGCLQCALWNGGMLATLAETDTLPRLSEPRGEDGQDAWLVERGTE